MFFPDLGSVIVQAAQVFSDIAHDLARYLSA
jgi:hypothetical protein